MLGVFGALVHFAPSSNTKGADKSNTNNEIAVVITSPNESIERTVSLADREALKKLKKRVTNILNDAIEGAPGTDTKPAIAG